MYKIPTGIYRVNGNEYLNKYKALENCNDGHWPEWDFHDEEYSKEDWSVEPKSDLYELYKQRAIQLREKYDNLLLYFSGGVDSLTVLRSFIDNNIKLDGIIITGCFDINDTLAKQCNTEQHFVGLPYLEDLRKRNLINCPVHQMDVREFFNFKNEEWVYSYTGTHLTPQTYASNFYWKDPWVQNFFMKGKTALIRGIDKPRVILEDDKWYFGFLDTAMAGSVSIEQLMTNGDRDNTEYFYWSPDFTSIVNKQAHICINWFEKNIEKKLLEEITSKDAKFNRSRYINYVDPLVYSKYITQLPGEERNYFTSGKPFSANLEHKDFWFTDARLNHINSFNAWTEGIKLLSQNISNNYFNKPNEMYDMFLKERNLTDILSDSTNVLSGVVGSWSKLHYIKDFNDNRITL